MIEVIGQVDEMLGKIIKTEVFFLLLRFIDKVGQLLQVTVYWENIITIFTNYFLSKFFTKQVKSYLYHIVFNKFINSQ